MGDDRASDTSSNVSSLIATLDLMSDLIEQRETATASWDQIEDVLRRGDLPRKAVHVLRGMVVVLRESCVHNQVAHAGDSVVQFLDQMQEVPDLMDLWSRSGRLALDGAQSRLLDAIDRGYHEHHANADASRLVGGAVRSISQYEASASPERAKQHQHSDRAMSYQPQQGSENYLQQASENYQPQQGSESYQPQQGSESYQPQASENYQASEHYHLQQGSENYNLQQGSDCISSASDSESVSMRHESVNAHLKHKDELEVRSGSVSNSVYSEQTSPSCNNQPDVLTLTEAECLMAASTPEAEAVAQLVLANDQNSLVVELGQLEANASNGVIDSVRACLLAMLHSVNLDVRVLAATGLRLVAEVQGERLLGWGEDHVGLNQVAELDIGHFGGSLKYVCAGDGFTHMLTDGGQVLGFGGGNRGQLGSGSRSDIWQPALVYGPWVDDDRGIVAIESGESHTLACDEVGRVYIWGELGPIGWGRPFEVFGMDPVGIVACGASFCAAVTTTGSMYMWGDNSYGQLGTGDQESRESPCMMINKAGFVVSTVACGGRHVVIGDSEGKLFSWGCGA